MVSILWVLFILDSLLLIGIILIQPGEGGDLAAAFGGASSQTAFGARGSTNFLQKATTWLAVLFMVLAIVLVIVTNFRHKNIVEKNIFKTHEATPSSAPATPPSTSESVPKKESAPTTEAPASSTPAKSSSAKASPETKSAPAAPVPAVDTGNKGQKHDGKSK